MAEIWSGWPSGWSAQGDRRKLSGRQVRPIAYGRITLPQTPQAQIDICLRCPLPDCRPKGCPLEKRRRRRAKAG
jgi:hypothetical protein